MNGTAARIGTAGWTVPRGVREQFADDGSGLQRYASRLNCVEVNSTFYRSHRADTWIRWAAETPADFRFAVKAPRRVTHELRLKDAMEPMAAFLTETALLGEKRGPVLVQMPGTLAFEDVVAKAFFAACRDLYEGPLVCEPRHANWFEPSAGALLTAHRVARVAADPAKVPAAAEPGGWSGLVYRRLHGSPRLYYTPYPPEALDALADSMVAERVERWCVFDNTMSSAAAANALELQARLGLTPRPRLPASPSRP